MTFGRHDIRDNDTQPNDIQHKPAISITTFGIMMFWLTVTKFDTEQESKCDTQHKETLVMLSVVILIVLQSATIKSIMLNVVMLTVIHADCHLC